MRCFALFMSFAACGDEGSRTGGMRAQAAEGEAGVQLPSSCAGAPTGAETLHAGALAALIPASADIKGPCAFGSCHDSNANKAQLILDHGTTDLHALLVTRPACEVAELALVDDSGGDPALAKSWLWQKLTAPADSKGALTKKDAWGAAVETCGQSSGDAPFGLRMPLSGTPDMLDASRLEPIRSWICAGAPGP